MRRDLDRERLGDHLDRLYRSAWALCGSHEEAEDLVQETFVRVLGRTRVLTRSDDLGYLLAALRNTFLDTRRSRARRPVTVGVPLDDLLVVESGDGSPEDALYTARVYGAIAALSDGFRDVIVAVNVEGLSYREAAKALGAKEGTIMSRLHRARAGRPGARLTPAARPPLSAP